MAKKPNPFAKGGAGKGMKCPKCGKTPCACGKKK